MRRNRNNRTSSNMNTNILTDFQICICVPLKDKTSRFINCIQIYFVEICQTLHKMVEKSVVNNTKLCTKYILQSSFLNTSVRQRLEYKQLITNLSRPKKILPSFLKLYKRFFNDKNYSKLLKFEQSCIICNVG